MKLRMTKLNLLLNENENIEVCVIDNLDLFDNITPRASKDNLGDVDHYY